MKRGAILFISCLVAFGLAEGLTRRFIPLDPLKQSLDRSQEHPYLRTDWVPGFQTTYVIDGIGGQTGTMEFKINDFGFRSSSMKTAKKPPGTDRIFFLGGSTTEQIYLPEEKTFVSLVEKELSKAFPERRFEGINAGASGYLAADALALLVYKVLYYEPDWVIVMLGVNDLRYGAVPAYDPVRRPNYQKILYRPGYRESALGHFLQILKRSHFLTLLKWRLVNRLFPPDAEKFQNKLEQYNEFRRARKNTPVSPITESRSLDDFIKYLEEIIFIAKGHGVELILMTEPTIYQENLPPEIDEKLWMGWLDLEGNTDLNLSNEFLFQGMRQFNDAVRSLSQRYGVGLIDLEKEIPKTLDTFYDDAHFTPLGAQRAAEVIAAYLVGRL